MKYVAQRYEKEARNLESNTKTIDITPEGLKSPEGAKRVSKALEAWQTAQADAANKSAQFFKEFEYEIELAFKSDRVDREDAAAAHESMDELKEAFARMQRRQEDFLRSLAGQRV